MKNDMPHTVERYTEKKIIKFLKSQSKNEILYFIEVEEKNLRWCMNIYDTLYYKFDYKHPKLSQDELERLDDAYRRTYRLPPYDNP